MKYFIFYFLQYEIRNKTFLNVYTGWPERIEILQ